MSFKNKNKYDRKRININIIATLLLFTVLGVAIYLRPETFSEASEKIIKYTKNIINNEEVIEEEIYDNKIEIEDNVAEVHFLDVDEGDSTLIISDGKTMLIDGGSKAYGDDIVKRLHELGIKKIDYLVGTHPHEDHIGGLYKVIDNFEIGEMILPAISTNTWTFENMLDSLIKKNIEVTSPEVGTIFYVGKCKCEIMLIGDGSEDEKFDLNLSTVVIRMEYGKVSYLFTGDAIAANEESRKWPETTVLKVAHHGSSSSSTDSFLSQVKPEISVISCGKNNDYGHPKSSVLNRLQKYGSKIYRTDENGEIIVKTDGDQIEIKVEKEKE